jgi:hypothetical protein
MIARRIVDSPYVVVARYPPAFAVCERLDIAIEIANREFSIAIKRTIDRLVKHRSALRPGGHEKSILVTNPEISGPPAFAGSMATARGRETDRPVLVPFVAMSVDAAAPG